MSYQTALAALAGLSVPGVRHNYPPQSLPTQLQRAQCPALLVMPIDQDDDRLFQERGGKLQTITFSGTARSVTATVTHRLLVQPAQSGHGLRTGLPALVTLIDAYVAAISADPTLGGALLQPPDLRIETGIYSLGGTAFTGCAFRHQWLLAVS